jgi:hypothetical protein
MALALSSNAPLEPPQVVRLTYREKVPVSAMKEIITLALQEKFSGVNQYDSEKANEAVKSLSETIKNRCKKLGYDRYKFVVQVVMGERRY